MPDASNSTNQTYGPSRSGAPPARTPSPRAGECLRETASTVVIEQVIRCFRDLIGKFLIADDALIKLFAVI